MSLRGHSSQRPHHILLSHTEVNGYVPWRQLVCTLSLTNHFTLLNEKRFWLRKGQGSPS